MRRLIIILTILLSVFYSCKETLDVYLGIPLQPRFDSTTFKPGLNIFGVLRVDSTEGHNNSFIILQRVMPVVGDSGSFEIDTALVWVSQNNNPEEQSTCEFLLSNNDSIFRETSYRPTCDFSPKPGQIYSVECIYEDLPVLNATTIIPRKPEISSPLSWVENTLEFELKADSTYFMVDVFAFYNSQTIGFDRLPATDESNILISMGALPVVPDSIMIFTYDYNLSVYYMTSNTTLNFNKYRKSYSIVENGYGVFGAINKAVFIPE